MHAQAREERLQQWLSTLLRPEPQPPKKEAMYIASSGTPASLQNIVLYKLVVEKVTSAILINWRTFITMKPEEGLHTAESMYL